LLLEETKRRQRIVNTRGRGRGRRWATTTDDGNNNAQTQQSNSTHEKGEEDGGGGDGADDDESLDRVVAVSLMSDADASGDKVVI
jgi:hypothetical protein